MNKLLFLFFLFSTYYTSSLLHAQTSLDPHFGLNGKITATLGTDGSIGQAMAIQKDGKIIVAGYASNKGLNYDFALIRYNTDGSLDKSFGTEGKVLTPVGNLSDYGKSLVLQQDGKILLAGYSSNGQNSDFSLVRYHIDGTLDRSFGNGGMVITPIGSLNDYGKSVAVQENGKIIIAGGSYNGYDYDFALVRYHSNGTIDASFGNNGIVITDVNNTNDNAEALAIDFFGNILVTGYCFEGADKDIALVKYTPAGKLDMSFNGNGKAIIDVNGTHNTANAISIQNDGKILVAGSCSGEYVNGFALLRFNKNGKLDYEFAENGKVMTSVGTSGNSGKALALQSDGKILLAGYAHNKTDYDFALIRYNTDGSLDDSFTESGELTSAIQNANDYGHAVAVQQDGKILIAGNTSDGSNESFALIRYIPTASITSQNTFEENFISTLVR